MGKSALCRYLAIKHQAFIFDEGKASDMKASIALSLKNKIKPPKIVVMDIPRSVTLISYTGIESIKNGVFFSPKYESGQVMMNSPHFIILANFEPDYEKLSNDRWHVYDIRTLADPSAQTGGQYSPQHMSPHSTNLHSESTDLSTASESDNSLDPQDLN